MVKSSFLQQIANSLAQHWSAWQHIGLGIALSGGADSVALLCALVELRKEQRMLLKAFASTAHKHDGEKALQHLHHLVALHCNFRLRGQESQGDEDFVCQLCDRLGVSLQVAHFDTHKEAKIHKESIEMAARRLRYAWFAQQNRCIVVAHHAEDNAETLLLNLVRGSGLRGLAAMKPLNHHKVLRPMLHCYRHEVMAFLAQKAQTYRHDSSNDEQVYRRNFMRHEVMPQLRKINPQIAATLHQTAQQLQAALRVYEWALQDLDQQLLLPKSTAQHLHISKEALTQKGKIGQVWLYETLRQYHFTPEQVLALQQARTGALFYSKQQAYVATSTRTTLEVAVNCLPELPQLRVKHEAYKQDRTYRSAKSTCAIAAEAVVGELRVRYAEQADRFSPLGMQGKTQLLSNYLTNRGRSRIEKMRQLCVCDDQGILWLVGETIAQRGCITADTKSVLQLELSSPR